MASNSERIEERIADLRILIGMPISREIALALTKLDECEMWLVKADVILPEGKR